MIFMYIELLTQLGRIKALGCSVLGREEEIKRVTNHCLSSEPVEGNPPLLIQGVDGIGKSSVLARCVIEMKQVGTRKCSFNWYPDCY